jgi:hypothetical protein
LNKGQAFLGGNGSNTNKRDDDGDGEVEDMNSKDKFSYLSIVSTYLFNYIYLIIFFKSFFANLKLNLLSN